MKTKRKASTLPSSYFILFESMLAPKSNQLLAVKELYMMKQGSMTSGEFHAQITKVVKRCIFSNEKAEERAIRDVLFLEINSSKARDRALNLMNEEGKKLTVDFLMQQLEIEDCNSHHKSQSQLDSTASVHFVSYDHRQNKQDKNKKNQKNGKAQHRNNPESRDLLILDISLETPRHGRKVYEMWET